MSTVSLAIILALASVPGEATTSFSTADIESQIAAARRARAICGPACVWFCLRRMNRDVDLNTVLDRAQMEDHGIRLDRLLDLAQSFGLPARAVVFNPKLLDAVPRPAILIIGESHCVALAAVDSLEKQARIFEPASGQIGPESMGLLTERWSGEAIIFAEPPMPLLMFTGWLTSTVLGTVAVVLVAILVVQRMRRCG